MLSRAPTPFAALRDVPPSLKLVQVIFSRSQSPGCSSWVAKRCAVIGTPCVIQPRGNVVDKRVEGPFHPVRHVAACFLSRRYPKGRQLPSEPKKGPGLICAKHPPGRRGQIKPGPFFGPRPRTASGEVCFAEPPDISPAGCAAIAGRGPSHSPNREPDARSRGSRRPVSILRAST